MEKFSREYLPADLTAKVLSPFNIENDPYVWGNTLNVHFYNNEEKIEEYVFGNGEMFDGQVNHSCIFNDTIDNIFGDVSPGDLSQALSSLAKQRKDVLYNWEDGPIVFSVMEDCNDTYKTVKFYVNEDCNNQLK